MTLSKVTSLLVAAFGFALAQPAAAPPACNSSGARFMTIHQHAAFDPETIEIMSTAYEGVCEALNLAGR